MKEGTQTSALETTGVQVGRGFNTYLGFVAAMIVIDLATKVGKGIYEEFFGEESGSDDSIKTLKADSPEAVKIRCFLEEVRKSRSEVTARYAQNPEALANDLQSIGMLGATDQSRWADEIAFLRGMAGADHPDPETVTPVEDAPDATEESSISFDPPASEVAELRELVEALTQKVQDMADAQVQAAAG